MPSKIVMMAIAGIVLLVFGYYATKSAPGFDPSSYTETALNCTTKLEVKCSGLVLKTVKDCVKATAEDGVNLKADLNCMKDFLKDEKECWPCICYFAERKMWDIKGC